MRESRAPVPITSATPTRAMRSAVDDIQPRKDKMTHAAYPNGGTPTDHETGPQTGTLYWLGRLLHDPELDPTETLLLIGLADHVNGDDICWVGIKRLASYARVSYGTARRRLTALEERGRIIRSRRHRDDGGESVYEYQLVRSPAHPPRNLRAAPRASERAGPPAHPGARAELPNAEPPNGELELALIDAPLPGPLFDDFWSAYPYKRGSRAAAERAWNAAVKVAKPSLIVAGARRLAADPNLPPKAEERFVRHGSTWLRDRGWEDGPLPARNGSSAPPIDTDRDAAEGEWALVDGEWVAR